MLYTIVQIRNRKPYIVGSDEYDAALGAFTAMHSFYRASWPETFLYLDYNGERELLAHRRTYCDEGGRVMTEQLKHVPKLSRHNNVG